MKTIGLLGGLSYLSTIDYYKQINSMVNAALGERHSAKIILNSLDYQELKKYDNKDWDSISGILGREIHKLDGSGVDCILVCNNTLHKAIDRICNQWQIKATFFHIVDCLGHFAVDRKHQKLLLLGTRFTMEDGFYANRLRDSFGLDVITPDSAERESIQFIIMQELVKGILSEKSKQWLLKTIANYSVDGVILGCTELPLIIYQNDIALPILNTVDIHCKKAVEFALLG